MKQDIFEKICTLLETTDRGVAKICGEFHLSTQTFYAFINDNETAAKRYLRAKELQQDLCVESMKTLEDECLAEVKSVENPKIANAIVSTYKLMIDDIKWKASKFRPKTFGDKLAVDHSGGLSVTRVELPQKCAVGDPVNNN